MNQFVELENKVIAYHGSPKRFDTFLIDEKLVRHDITSLAEGYGVYMATDKNFAKGYGQYVYTIEMNKEDITDFTNPKVIRDLITTISKEVKIPISDYVDVNMLVESVLNGSISTTKLYKEISDLLDSEFSFYDDYGSRITYEEDCLFEEIRNSFFKNIKDIICYYDMSFDANIFICFRNEDKLNILSIE